MVFIESDVLVLGTGGAGLRAAIEAKARGTSVAVVSKATSGMNNATVVAGGGFRAAVGGLTVDEHFDDTILSGKEIDDRRLVEVLAQEGGKRVLELRKFGVDIHMRSGARTRSPIGVRGGGLGLTRPLVDYARSKGIRFFENVIVTRLIADSDAVVGAIGFDVHNDRPIVFSSKSVILATGGAGALYSRTSNPLRTTGDGYSLAYEVGARLRDMEFVQFFPLALAEPGVPSHNIRGFMSENGRIINSLGENIPQKHGVTARPFVLKSRDLLSRAIMIEVLEGRGVDGAVLLDATEVFKQRGEEEFSSIDHYTLLRDRLKAAKRPFRVAPVSHFCMGGVIIDEHCNTDVPGLFAAGEVVGGIHGANRHGGNALTDITVFGARAGSAAAEYAKTRSLVSVESAAEAELCRYEDLRRSDVDHEVAPRNVLSRLRETMWIRAGVVREEAKLEEAISEISELTERVSRLRASTGRMMLEALEVSLALEVAEMICRSALERTESRGAHYRTDYPNEDKGWLKTIILSQNANGKMRLSSEPT